MRGLPISAIVLSKNEEKNIARCLDSLTFLNEVVLVDSFSTDATVSIARRYNNVKVVEHEWLGFAGSKKLGLSVAVNEWILWVDADESVSDSLRAEISALFQDYLHTSSGNLSDVYLIGRRTYFVGKWVAHCGWHPDWVNRLFRRTRASFDDRLVHEGLALQPGATKDYLRGYLEHYSYNSIGQYFEKMLCYGKLGADELIRQGKVASLVDVSLRPIFAFLRVFLLKRGCLDGRVGLVIAMGTAFSTFVKYTHLLFFKNAQDLHD